MLQNPLPVIIQGGMGVGISDWKLARAVCLAGQLGVVSGTAIDVIVARRLESGDPDGHVRRALQHLPLPGVADRILERYFTPGGKPPNRPFKSKPLPSEAPSRAATELIVASNFVEVFLAKEGHDRPVGINLLEKIQAPTLPSLYGAMLAGVSCVLMGAGIPRSIPGALDRLANHQSAELRLDVQGALPSDSFVSHFDPSQLEANPFPQLTRPAFFAIVSSASLATILARKSNGRVDGFIIESHTAGGHNAPPRGTMQLTAKGEPIYGERDIPDLAAIRALGLPFWLAGSYAHPDRIREAREAGAAGVQIGTAFAFCDESGLAPHLKAQVIALVSSRPPDVFTDPLASPTGFPFKVLPLPGTLADPLAPARSLRICDLGYLRTAFRTPDGSLGWRCPAEPIDDFIAKGGHPDDTRGRACICNALLANTGLGQLRTAATPTTTSTLEPELPLITTGDDIACIAQFVDPVLRSYTAANVIANLLNTPAIAPGPRPADTRTV